ncbi:hypothetical protein HSB1_13100 [Halogranum salarium B-1]|uniref:Uncharacterized protein n=1 Tax=Halogranum salarium B-1 TaxID=1210908 RepID=J3EZ14_9EURY|nr:hypothetical protein HSB1_13100 [Halogranum salarium B-1]
MLVETDRRGRVVLAGFTDDGGRVVLPTDRRTKGPPVARRGAYASKSWWSSGPSSQQSEDSSD